VSSSSIGKLFLGGIVPGFITAILLSISVIFVARTENVERLKRAPFKVWFLTFLDSLPSIITVVILLGGIFTGKFTPTEASVVAVIYTVFLGIVYRKITWKNLINELYGAMKVTARIMFIVACSSLFGQVVIRTQMAAKLTTFMLSTFHSPVVILIVINFILLVVGCFLEQSAAILVVTPILFPLMSSIGLGDIHIGLIIVFNLMIGLLTPPFGLVLFALSDVGKISMKRTLKGVMPYYPALFIVLSLITYIPWVSEYVPSLFFK
jgi:tripartite ATP-independent transporter DctM subunit